MNCNACGAPLEQNAAFCAACGRSQTGAAVPDSAAVQGFLASLFDLSFTSFITTKLIKVLYVLGMVSSALMALFLVISGFARGSGTGLFMLIIVAPVLFLISVIYCRVLMELFILFFRMAEHLAELVRQGRRT